MNGEAFDVWVLESLCSCKVKRETSIAVGVMLQNVRVALSLALGNPTDSFCKLCCKGHICLLRAGKQHCNVSLP